MDPNFLIETPRLLLSHFLPSDPKHCAFLVTTYNSPLFIASEGETGIVDNETARERIEGRFVQQHQQFGYGTYLVSLKPSPATDSTEPIPIGSVSLTRGLEPGSCPVPDIGYAIIPEMNGQGYATESAKYLLEHAKTVLHVQEVFGFCSPDAAEAASMRVMEKIGMTYKGVWRIKGFNDQPSHVYVLPGMKDVAQYAIGQPV
ncbi:acyl-CoA N-acyltransferase [Tothia fuscella]|uniref:Acyl-CoA N-acyltransferase n=1 Tax=Tothia fuscella TaxID=1048955 RepID=A0A9P4NIW5_9PEZI|nr:acyl-CoA N-acyltransferase [Tothia fuscella]